MGDHAGQTAASGRTCRRSSAPSLSVEFWGMAVTSAFEALGVRFSARDQKNTLRSWTTRVTIGNRHRPCISRRKAILGSSSAPIAALVSACHRRNAHDGHFLATQRWRIEHLRGVSRARCVGAGGPCCWGTPPAAAARPARLKLSLLTARPAFRDLTPMSMCRGARHFACAIRITRHPPAWCRDSARKGSGRPADQ